MIKSMTGFGRAQETFDGREITVEIKSVNHRYFEFSARTPRAYGYLEEKLKSFVSGKISRGKVEASVLITNREGTDAEIAVNLGVAEGYLTALREANKTLGLTDDLTLAGLMRLPDVFNVQKASDDEETTSGQVIDVAGKALEKFVEMRIAEGKKMSDDISSRLDFIESEVGKIENRSPEVTRLYRERLESRIKELLDGASIDEQRLVTEAAIFSEKTAVDEETVRLRSHIAQYRELLCSDTPVGRKLDFLTQELNREVNTIGSKGQDLEITRIVVDLKSEIEKIREQIQNVE